MKAFAVMTPQRWPALPDVPTTDEVGVPEMHISFWHGLWVPKGTPQAVIDKLNAAVVDTLADPAVRQRLTELGQVIATREEQTPAALAASPQGRDREMVADHQGGQHQGELNLRLPRAELRAALADGRQNPAPIAAVVGIARAIRPGEGEVAVGVPPPAAPASSDVAMAVATDEAVARPHAAPAQRRSDGRRGSRTADRRSAADEARAASGAPT